MRVGAGAGQTRVWQAMLLMVASVWSEATHAQTLLKGEVARAEGVTGRIVAMAQSPDGKFVVIATDAHEIIGLDAQTLKVVKQLGKLKAEPTGIAMLKDYTVITSTKQDSQDKHSLLFWDWKSTNISRRVPDTEQSLYGVNVSADESLMVVSQGTEDIRLYGVTKDSRLGLDLPQTKPRCECAIFAPDGKSLLMGSGVDFIRWEIGDGVKPAGEIVGEHTSTPDALASAQCLAFAPDGKKFVSGHNDGYARLWDLATGKMLGRMQHNKSIVNSVAISPDGKYIATGSDALRIWNVVDQQLVFMHRSPSGGVYQVLFTSNTRVVAGGYGVSIWSVDANERSAGQLSKRPMPSHIRLRPVPKDEDLVESNKLIKELFADEYAKAKRPTDKVALAQKLAKQALRGDVPLNDAYALWQEVVRLASEGGDRNLAITNGDRLMNWFDLPDDYMAPVIGRLGESISETEELEQLASLAMKYGNDCFKWEEFDGAEQYGRVALKIANQAKKPATIKKIREFAEKLKLSRKAFEDYQDALLVLKTQSTDPTANETVGRYFCFAKQEWTKGIPYLALSASPELSAAAALELAKPKAGDDMLKVAEAWQAAALKASVTDRPYYVGSAHYWYRQAARQLSGLQKAKVEKSLEKLGQPTHPRN